MDEIGGGDLDLGAKGTDERLGRVACRPSLLGELVDLEAVGAARSRDRRCCLERDHAGGGLGTRKRALGVEHRCQPGLVRDGLADRGGDEQRRERRQCAKKVVASEPCMWMSKRMPPAAGTPTSVSRSPDGSLERNGSAPFASCSSGK